MATLLEIRDRSISIYRQYETIFSMLFKFLLALSALSYINNRIGYEENLTTPLFVVFISLVCALIPYNGMIGILAIVILIHLNSLAIEAMAVGVILFLLMFLLYFRFTPKDTVLLALTPMCNFIGIPYLLPLIGGLIFTPVSAVTASIGVVAVSFVNFVHDNETAIGASGDSTDLVSRFRFLVDGVLQNKAMLCMIAAMCVATIVVYIIRRLMIRYSWYIASVVGALLELIIVLVGDMLYSTGISIGGVFVGVIFSILICLVITFYAFNLDYSRIENTQFEDDDYYYYVRAVPKNVYVAPRRTVKQINTSRHTGDLSASSEIQSKEYADDYADDGYAGGNDQADAYGYGEYPLNDNAGYTDNNSGYEDSYEDSYSEASDFDQMNY